MRTIGWMVAMAFGGAAMFVNGLASGVGPGDAWKPVAGKPMTEWGAKVTPDNVWPEYPRPSLVRKEWMNLNGLWEYAILGMDSAGTDKVQGKILVPFPPESALSGVGRRVGPDQTIHYRRTFEIPASWKGRRTLVHFGAVDWRCEVRVNGRDVGAHSGGYDPFSFDITDALNEGSNEIVVIAHDPTDTGGQGRGKQWLQPHGIWYTPTSGIWQTVWLEPVSDVHLERIRCHADPRSGEIDFWPEITGSVTADVKVAITIEKTGAHEATIEIEGSPAHPRVALPNPHAWTPDDPFLYDLKITITRAGQVIDEVSSYFAYRTIAIGKDGAGVSRLMLNGAPVFQFGPLDQGFWPDGLYTPPSDEALKFDIVAAKRMGANMLRKHVKVEPDRFYTWCDRLGIMVWQDMPSPFFSDEPAGSEKNKFNNPTLTDEWKKTFEAEWAEIIKDLSQHPSIVMWVPWNEGWGQNDLEWAQQMAELTKKLDPTRLVNNASGWTDMGVGDVIDIHAYPGPALAPVEDRRASVLGEFGGLGLPIEGHTWIDKDNWGYVTFKSKEELTHAYLGLIEKMPMLIGQGLCAAVYTQTTDVEIEVNGWLTYDRKVWKIDPDAIRDATMKLYEPPPEVHRILGHAGDGLSGSWRFTATEPPADSSGRAWSDVAFDDSTWILGRAGFGTSITPGALVETEWNTSDIWLRTTFEATPGVVQRLSAGVGSSLGLSIHHDENARVYLNGTLIAELQGFTTGYVMVPLPGSAAKVMKPGLNTLAVHCSQTRGGQYIDCGLVEIVHRK